MMKDILNLLGHLIFFVSFSIIAMLGIACLILLISIFVTSTASLF